MQTDAREAPGNTALPPLRAGRANAPVRDRRAPLMCNARRFRQGGLGANKPPRWSAERRASPGARTAKAGLRGDARRAIAPAGLRHWPADGCRCTRAPVGAPPPHFVVRGFGKPRRVWCLARRKMRARLVTARRGRWPSSFEARLRRAPQDDGDSSVRSPHGAISAFTRVFDALWRNAGFMPRSSVAPDFASLHPGYEEREMQGKTSKTVRQSTKALFDNTNSQFSRSYSPSSRQ